LFEIETVHWGTNVTLNSNSDNMDPAFNELYLLCNKKKDREKKKTSRFLLEL